MKIVWHLFAIAFALLSSLTAEGETKVICFAHDISGVSPRDAASPGTPFDIDVTVIYPHETHDRRRASIFVGDKSGHAVLQNYIAGTNFLFRAGDRVHATGVVIGERGGIYAHCTNMTLLAHGEPPQVVRTTVGELLSGKFDGRLVTVQGEVTDAFVDDIDKAYIYLILSSDGQSIYVPFPWREMTQKDAEALIGSIIETTGIFANGHNVGRRRCIGRLLEAERTYPLRIVRATKKDPFDVPDLSTVRFLDPDKMFTTGRRRVIGTVLASWHGDRAILKTDDGFLVRLDMASSEVPASGLRIEAAGLPETDLYNVNLRRVRWRPADGIPLKAEQPERVTAALLLGYAPDNRKTGFHGHAVKLKGIVRGLPPDEGDGRVILEDSGFLLSVDFSKCPQALADVTIGCTVEINGIAVMEVDNWRPSAIFPKIKEVFVVVSSPSGLAILERPPWWTPARLLVVIIAMLALILAIVIWNRSLHTLAERRGRELTKETVSHVESELKVSERTRLAVELHDTIAQYLTGAIMEIRTGVRLSSDGHPTASEHFALAQKTLESCRQELRNCLWDLRNRALEQSNMDAAIRQTLAPHVKNVDLAVRFNVPREMVSDNTAHAILRIIRELVINATRHGHATAIKIAGSVEGGKLLFSVKDNGCGFTPDEAPGIEDGHFGIQGIRERITAFNGDLIIESTPGKGAKATVLLTMPTTSDSKPETPNPKL